MSRKSKKISTEKFREFFKIFRNDTIRFVVWFFVTMQKDVYFKLDNQFIKILIFSTLRRLWFICVGKNFATILAQLDF